MSIADCKRGRKNHKNDPRYNRQMQKDPAVRAKKLKEQIERERRIRQGGNKTLK